MQLGGFSCHYWIRQTWTGRKGDNLVKMRDCCLSLSLFAPFIVCDQHCLAFNLIEEERNEIVAIRLRPVAIRSRPVAIK